MTRLWACPPQSLLCILICVMSLTSETNGEGLFQGLHNFIDSSLETVVGNLPQDLKQDRNKLTAYWEIATNLKSGLEVEYPQHKFDTVVYDFTTEDVTSGTNVGAVTNECQKDDAASLNVCVAKGGSYLHYFYYPPSDGTRIALLLVWIIPKGAPQFSGAHLDDVKLRFQDATHTCTGNHLTGTAPLDATVAAKCVDDFFSAHQSRWTLGVLISPGMTTKMDAREGGLLLGLVYQRSTSTHVEADSGASAWVMVLLDASIEP